MDCLLTEEHKMLQATVRDFAAKEIATRADEVDRTEEFPFDSFKKMAELGLFGLNVPPDYGGNGGDTLSFAIAVEEISRACASTGDILLTQSSVIKAIYYHGTDEQKKKYLPLLIKGELVGAGAITEAEAGSDVSNIRTTAVRDGDSYILNGTKTFITHGPVCDVVDVHARYPGTDKRSMTTFLVDDGTPGFIKGKKYEKVGLRGAVTGELVFEDCRIPVSNRLGDEGRGFKHLMELFGFGRINIASQALGIAQAVLENSIEYAKQRVQFGRPIADNQAIAFMLADMATELEAARMLVYEASYMADQGIPFAKQAAMAKLFASEAAMKAATNGVQIYGGYGYMMDSPMQRYFRDAKITTIYDGTSEIQRLIISRILLK